jgi:hypothetical protein
MRAPAAVLLKRDLSIFGNLRCCRRERAEHDGSGDHAKDYAAANQSSGSQMAQLVSDSHDFFPCPSRFARLQLSCDAPSWFRVSCPTG